MQKGFGLELGDTIYSLYSLKILTYVKRPHKHGNPTEVCVCVCVRERKRERVFKSDTIS